MKEDIKEELDEFLTHQKSKKNKLEPHRAEIEYLFEKGATNKAILLFLREKRGVRTSNKYLNKFLNKDTKKEEKSKSVVSEQRSSKKQQIRGIEKFQIKN